MWAQLPRASSGRRLDRRYKRHAVCAYPWIAGRPWFQNGDMAELDDWCLEGRIVVGGNCGNEVLLREGPDARAEAPVLAYSKQLPHFDRRGATHRPQRLGVARMAHTDGANAGTFGGGRG